MALSQAAQHLLDLACLDAAQRAMEQYSFRNVMVSALDLGAEGPLAPIFHVGRNEEFRRRLEEGLGRRPRPPRLSAVRAQRSPILDLRLRQADLSGDETGVRELLHACLADESVSAYLQNIMMSSGQVLELADDSRVPKQTSDPVVLVDADGGAKPDEKRTPFSRDLTQLACEGKLSGAQGREKEILRLRSALNRMNQNNPLLVGLPGTVKSALVEQLAIEIAQGLHHELADVTLLEMDLPGMVAGTRYRGEFEERLKTLIETIRRAGGKIIPFIDEIHLIVGAGAAEGSMDTANILKPPLARGELRVIGATTPMEHRLRIESDSALDRRFSVIRVEPPSEAETETILLGALPRFERHHRVKIAPAAASTAVKLAGRYLTNRQFPDKAFFVLDDAAAFLRASKPDAESLQSDDVMDAVERVTGVPVKQLRLGDRERLANLEGRLKELVVGQPEAVRAMVERMKESHAGMTSLDRPIPGFLFVGPSGVGKTHLAKTFADEYFKTAGSFQKFDMSQFAGQAGHASLLGAPMGTVGSDRGGCLTNLLRQHPYAVYLFDEIEKGDPDVLNIFLGILDSGRLSGRDGVEVDCRHAVFMFTSNIGASQHDDTLPFDELRSRYIESLNKRLPPELVGRMQVVPFYRLNRESARSVVSLLLRDVQKLARQGSGTMVRFDEMTVDELVTRALDTVHGARALRQIVDEKVKRPLVDWLLTTEKREGVAVLGRWGKDGVVFEVEPG